MNPECLILISYSERANASLHELEDVLLGTSSGRGRVETSRAKVQLQATVNPRTLKWYEDNARPQKYKHAVSKLSAILKEIFNMNVFTLPTSETYL